MISRFMDGAKEYEATLKLGIETETMDPEGREISRRPVGFLAEEKITCCLDIFHGTQLQQPPGFSALKHKGKPLYYYARKGIEVKKEPREITIHELERLGSGNLAGDHPELKIRVLCSKGTYIRSLCQDLGRALGTLGTLAGLRRTRSGSFCLDQSVDIEQVKTMNRKEIGNRLLDLDYGLGHFPRLVLDREEIPDFFQGKTIGRKGVEAEVLYRVYGADLFLGIGMGQKQDQLKGKKVFVREITGGSI